MGDDRSVHEGGKDQGLPTTPRPVSIMILSVERVGPLGKALLGKLPIFSCSALSQPLEVPAPRIWKADHDQGHTLSRREPEGRLRLERSFFVAGFDNSHG